ncbi:SDR family NAD(P)-dependent oxidoreductase [Acinetobacter sp. B51(2017)]|uniref:SDR family NAD(P)-dependent oxidoreductase n=1 Tax=Acinetobacter sp. B51(2017) TaxID=2060938 RepID=UPI000F0901FB|nr:SDR family NAD(P)-dependent oxidoreductase [Acinetobacter sp. B51(2017)]
MQTFHNKVAAITGAGSGIGQQLAILLAKQGCHLALSDLNEQRLLETLALLNNPKIQVTIAKVDVAQQAQVEQWAQDVVAQHGKVNMIFNNAGLALGSTIEGASYEELEWIMGINFWGVVYGTKSFLPLIKQTADGHVINLSSVFGLTAQPTQAGYNASKFAVRGFTEALRQELDLQNCGVSALCVHPGGIKTNIANAARINHSLATLGMNIEDSSRSFNDFLRYPAKQAAQDILDAVLKNKRRVLIGNDAKALDLIQRLLPSAYQRLMQMGSQLRDKFK